MKMKKKLLFKMMLFASLGIAFITMKSDIDGRAGSTTTGCKSCHGANAVATTSINLTGAPTNGYMPGASYTMTLTVGSSNAAMVSAGFGLKASAGTSASLTGQGTTTKSGELVHSAPKTFVAGTATWTYTWTAPTAGTGSVIVNIAGNAVNGDGNQTAADQWNIASYTIAENTAPQAIHNAVINKLNISPNPCTTQLQIANATALTNVKIVAINGTICDATMTSNKNIITINTSNLSAGIYIITAVENSVFHYTKFVKN
jgi:hypothetical protein